MHYWYNVCIIIMLQNEYILCKEYYAIKYYTLYHVKYENCSNINSYRKPTETSKHNIKVGTVTNRISRVKYLHWKLKQNYPVNPGCATFSILFNSRSYCLCLIVYIYIHQWRVQKCVFVTISSSLKWVVFLV